MLTKKQLQLLQFIAGYIGKNAVAPTYKEMMRAMNLRGPGGLHFMVKRLEDRGYIRRSPDIARGIEIVKVPLTCICPTCGRSDMPASVTPLPAVRNITTPDNTAPAKPSQPQNRSRQ